MISNLQRYSTECVIADGTLKGNISQHLGSKEVKSTQRLCLPGPTLLRGPMFLRPETHSKQAQSLGRMLSKGGASREWHSLLVVLGSICSTMLLRKHAETTH